MSSSFRRERGFTLIELLVVVAIIAILATIATMSYFTALDRSRQKRTLADMRTIATAWESRASDSGTYGVSGYTFPATAVTYDQLTSVLTPTYTRQIPRYDGWEQPFQFGVGDPGTKDYAIRSSGRNRAYESNQAAEGETDNPDCDIIFANGTFVLYPAGVQGK